MLAVSCTPSFSRMRLRCESVGMPPNRAPTVREGYASITGSRSWCDQSGTDGVAHHAGGFVHPELLQDAAAVRIGRDATKPSPDREGGVCQHYGQSIMV